MKIISHRGNLKGPDPIHENTQSHIDFALKKSYDVEIDLWKIGDKFLLGHDKPENEVELDWLGERKDNLWIHTKNFHAFEDLLKKNNRYNFFYHTNEPLVLVSNGVIWSHKPNEIYYPERCIIPLLNKSSLVESKKKNWFGVCTDYPILLEKIFNDN